MLYKLLIIIIITASQWLNSIRLVECNIATLQFQPWQQQQQQQHQQLEQPRNEIKTKIRGRRFIDEVNSIDSERVV